MRASWFFQQTPIRSVGPDPVRRATAAAALTLALWASGCAGPPEEVTGSGVRDDAGRVLEAVSPRLRVVSLVPGLTEALLAMGSAGEIVARTRYDLDPRLANLPSVGGGLDPSLEALVALEPDLVVAWPDGDTRSVGSALERLGVAVYAGETQTLDDYRRHTRNLGRLVGREDAAEALVEALDAAMATLATRLEGVDRPSVLLVVSPDPPQTTGHGTFPDALLTAAGAENVFGDLSSQWPLVSLEEIVRREPDYVVVTEAPSAPTLDPAASLRDAQGWRELEAVRSGRVLVVDPDLFMRPGPRMAEAASTLARLLHPDRIPG